MLVVAAISVYAPVIYDYGIPFPANASVLPPNRMSPNTATAFLLLAASLLLVDKPFLLSANNVGRVYLWPYQVLAFAVILDGAIGLHGHLVGVIYLYGVTHAVGIAIPTAALFVVLGIGALFTRMDRGVMAVLASDSIAAHSARRLLPTALLTPVVLGGVTLFVVRLHRVDTFFLAYLVVFASLVLVASMIWKTITALHDQVELTQDYSRQVAALEREKVESALKVTEERLQFAINGAQLGTWHWDLREGTIEWSPRFRQMLSIDPSVKSSLATLRSVVHPDDWEMVDDARLQAIGGNTDYAVEYRVTWPDGSVHWIASHCHGYYEADSTPLRFEVIAQDITERREGRARQQVFMRDMLSSVTEGKLALCLSAKELPEPLTPVGDPLPLLASGEGIRDIRNCALEACSAAHHPQERYYDLQTAVDEAAMNAVVHAGGGARQVSVGPDGTVRVRISDSGKGISLENLPSATLKKDSPRRAPWATA